MEYNKWDCIGLDNHLKVSTISGLIDQYRGASAYLNDQKNPAQMTRTVVCRIKSKKEKLELTQLISAQDVPNTERKGEKQNLFKEATHVVVGVVYGAEFYCVLSGDLVEDTNHDAREDAKDDLARWAEKMESALEENQDLITFIEQFDKEEKMILSRMKCRLFTDVLNPTSHECSFFDAYKICLKLIEQIKRVDVKSKAVPITLKLCPLNVLLTIPVETITAQSIEYREVDANLIKRCCKIWDELEHIVFKAKDDLNSKLKNGCVISLNKLESTWIL